MLHGTPSSGHLLSSLFSESPYVVKTVDGREEYKAKVAKKLTCVDYPASEGCTPPVRGDEWFLPMDNEGTWELVSSDESSATFKLNVHMAWEGIPFPLVLPALDIVVGFEGSNRAITANDPPAITRGMVGRLTPWEEAPGGGAGTFRFRQQTGVQIVPVKLVIQDDPAVTGGCFRPLVGTLSLYI